MWNPLTGRLTIASAQLNPKVGDINFNVRKAQETRIRAANSGADLVVFSELFISGYPPEDLILRKSFQDSCLEAVHFLAKETANGGPALLVGTPWREREKLYNACCLLDFGEISAVRYKHMLPDYGPFGESRLFCSGPLPAPVLFRDVAIGLLICEDLWGQAVAKSLAEQGAEVLISINASPFCSGKWDSRFQVAKSRIRETGLPLLYVNQVGGQDELVFDGGSFALQAEGSVESKALVFAEDLSVTQWFSSTNRWKCQKGTEVVWPDSLDATYMACVFALRDYITKNGFSGIVIGLSGGLDSALCATMATDALGAENVHCLMLPHKFTSKSSLIDAADCAKSLGVRYSCVSIESAVEIFEKILDPLLGKHLQEGMTQENIQARARGLILMAVSNALGGMLLTTGNKSELAVGYTTLYGDMNGGYNPIKDVYKTEVIALAKMRNMRCPCGALGPDIQGIIPESILRKDPSAELRENQRDSDFLPPYEILDSILYGLLEEGKSVSTLVACGHDPVTVAWVENAIHTAEYKRRQSAPGVKVSGCHLGLDRRYPIVNAFRDKG